MVQVIAQADALTEEESAAAVDQVRSEQERFGELEVIALRPLTKQVCEAVEIHFLMLGYRRTNGGWSPMKHNDPDPTESRHDPGNEVLTRELFEHLVRQAERGDRQAAEQLRQVLKDHPEIWGTIGDLSRHVERSLIDLFAGGNFVFSESLRHKAEDVRRSLIAEGADEPLEKLLVDHVVACWLELHLLRMAAIQPQQNKGDARFWEQRQERANKRYTSAIRDLASVREMLGGVAGSVVPMSASRDKSGDAQNSSVATSEE
jgi:hypothetical protein